MRRRLADEVGPSQQQPQVGGDDVSQLSQEELLRAWALESARKARAAVVRAYLAAAGQTGSSSGNSDGTRSAASLSQGFMSSATAVSEVGADNWV